MDRRAFLSLLAAAPAGLAACRTAAVATSGGPVIPGVEGFAAGVPAAVRGKRIGLVTNHTGIDRAGVSSIDRLAALTDTRLVALYGPEHGLRGTAAPGELIDSAVDARTGLPVHSLYTASQKPTPAQLEGVDALVFDVQDVGVRAYTYVWTMALAMQAAAERGIPFVVLDRPNPIGGTIVEGNILDPRFATFVGLYPVALRHGLTAGELARWLNAEHRFGTALEVVPAAGWRRSMWFDETRLPWRAPSPNLRTLEAAAHYPGTVLFEGTPLSVGRGSDTPYEHVGAPWLRAEEVVREMERLRLPGVEMAPVSFTPRNPADDKFPDTALRGVRLRVTDRGAYRPVATSLHLLAVMRRMHADVWEWNVAHFDRLAGTDRLRAALDADALAPVLDAWEADARAFEASRRPYLLYP